MSDRFIVTGNFTDDPFAIDMAQYIGTGWTWTIWNISAAASKARSF